MNPKVSFIVPCYKLGHLLPECIESILCQSYQDFEILIMDDCSPDNTPEVVKSFRDKRVRHVRNEPNLGHLRNYNKGIELAKGEYIWLISADDRLRSSQVLERYVRLMDGFPNVGYTFCPAIKLVDGQELGVMRYSEIASHDTVFNGHKFLTEHLAFANIVPAPAALARKKCYEQVSVFPLDLPHSGDWYLWGMFALYFDVGFCAEPMVNRRFHKTNMSSGFYKEATAVMFADNLGVLQRIRARAEKEGFDDVVEGCKRGIVAEYLRQVTPPNDGDAVQAFLTPEEFEKSLRSSARNGQEEARIRALVFAGLGDHYYERRDIGLGRDYYRRALSDSPYLLKVWAKYLLLKMGGWGRILREFLSEAKAQARGGTSQKW
jgi:glycosyltransferase involved in cell wall biosynthesis